MASCFGLVTLSKCFEEREREICPLSWILEGSKLLPWCPPSLQHEDAPGAKHQGEVLAVEEERAQVLGRVEQLKIRVKELEQQLQEAAREVTWLGGVQALGWGPTLRSQALTG